MSVWKFGEWKLLVSPGDISYVKFILEGYDGLGIVSTRDTASSQIVITYPLAREDVLARLVQALHNEGFIREGVDT